MVHQPLPLTLPSTESKAWQYITLDPNFLKQAPLILQQHSGITSLSGGIGPGGAWNHIGYNFILIVGIVQYC